MDDLGLVIKEHLLHTQSELFKFMVAFYESKRRGFYTHNPVSEITFIVNNQMERDIATLSDLVIFLKNLYDEKKEINIEDTESLVKNALHRPESLKYVRNERAEKLLIESLIHLSVAYHSLEKGDISLAVGCMNTVWNLAGIAKALTQKELPLIMVKDIADIRRSNGGKKRAANYEPIKKQLLAHWLNGDPKTGKKWRSQASCAGDFLDILSESGLYHPSQKVAERWLSKAIGDHQKK